MKECVDCGRKFNGSADVCFQCKLPMLSASAIPSRQNNVPPRKTEDPSWEKGRILQRRPDGSVMPYIKPDGTNLNVYEYQGARSKWDGHIADAHSGKVVVE